MSRVNEDHTAANVEKIEWVCPVCGFASSDYRGTTGTCNDCDETLTAEVEYE